MFYSDFENDKSDYCKITPKPKHALHNNDMGNEKLRTLSTQ